MQREFCIKERYPNIGLFKHTVQRSDAFRNSPLSKEITNAAESTAVDLVDKTLTEVLRDPLFGEPATPFKILPSSPSSYDLPQLSEDSSLPGGSSEAEGVESDSGSASGSGMTITSRERSDSKRAVKGPLRLSAFGIETLELTVA